MKVLVKRFSKGNLKKQEGKSVDLPSDKNGTDAFTRDGFENNDGMFVMAYSYASMISVKISHMSGIWGFR
jgi:hypothetical protein